MIADQNFRTIFKQHNTPFREKDGKYRRIAEK